MKLYYKPGACSLASHIVLLETGLDFTLEQVDLAKKVTEHGDNYLHINPKGQVPALLLDDGTLLTEGAAILQYLADSAPARQLLAPTGNLHRYQTVAWLNYIGSELHRSYSPLFRPTVPDAYKATVREELERKLRYVNDELAGKQWLSGQHFSVADAFLFTVLSWSPRVQLDLSGLAHITAFMERMQARPTVKEALVAENH